MHCDPEKYSRDGHFCPQLTNQVQKFEKAFNSVQLQSYSLQIVLQNYCKSIAGMQELCWLNALDVLSVRRTARAASEGNNIPDLSYKGAFFLQLY